MRAALGSIQRLDHHRYRIVTEDKPNPATGKRQRKTKVVRGTRKDAEIELAKMRLEVGKATGAFDDKPLSLYWETMYAPTFVNFAAEYARKLDGIYKAHIKPLFGDCIMGELTRYQIEMGLMAIEAPHTRRDAFKYMRQAFNRAWNDDLIENNPFLKKFNIPMPRAKEQPVMDAAQLAEWVDAMRGFRYEAAVLVIAGAGLRREEVMPLLWSDLDFVEEEGTTMCLIQIWRVMTDLEQKVTKTERSTRTVVIAGKIAQRLEELRDAGPLVPNKFGEVAKPHTLSYYYKKWCEGNDVKYFTLRNLRTTYATVQQEIGTDIATISRNLGHTKLSIDYTHYFMANKSTTIAAARALGSAIENEGKSA